MNRVVKLASSIGILVMLAVVVGGLPTAAAQQAPNTWRTKIDIECALADNLVAIAIAGIYIYHDFSEPPLGFGSVSCRDHQRTNYVYVYSPYSRGVPNGYFGSVRINLLGLTGCGISCKSCTFRGEFGPSRYGFGYCEYTSFFITYMAGATIFPPEAIFVP